MVLRRDSADFKEERKMTEETRIVETEAVGATEAEAEAEADIEAKPKLMPKLKPKLKPAKRSFASA